MRTLLIAALVSIAAVGFTSAPPDLEATIRAVQGGLTSLPAEAAVDNIDGWRDALRASPNPIAREVYYDLGSLREELTSSEIDGERVGGLLIELGFNTQRLSIGLEGEMAANMAQLGRLLADAGFMLV